MQAVLAEEGLEHDAALTAALERIAALRIAEPPAPTGELARLLAGGQAADSATAPLGVVLPLTRAAARKAEAAAAAPRPRWIKRHRGAMIGVLVAAGMGLGASGVAAMTGQVWAWHAPLHPAVGPSLTHSAEPLAPGDAAPTGTPTGTTAPPQGAGTAGAAAGGTGAGEAGERGAARPVQGRDDGASPAAREAGDQGPQDQVRQDQQQPQGSARGRASGDSTEPARPSQGSPRPSPSGTAGGGQGGEGLGGDTQDSGR
ncbi:hypothetical protein GCM10027090_14930 [Sinomonas soli]